MQTTTTEAQIDSHLTSLRLIQSDHATYEAKVHDAALRTRDENDLIVAQELGTYLGWSVNVDTLHELGEHLHIVEYGLYEDGADCRWHEVRVESFTCSILAGPTLPLASEIGR